MRADLATAMVARRLGAPPGAGCRRAASGGAGEEQVEEPRVSGERESVIIFFFSKLFIFL